MSSLQRCGLAALSLSLGACASAPEHLYTLDTSAHPSAPSASDVPVVFVGPVAVPEVVDRPQLVVRDGKYRVVVNEQERWATPLKDSLPFAVAVQLGEQCSNARFRTLSNTAGEAPHAVLSVDFTNIEIDRTAGVSVAATWAYHNAGQRALEGVANGHASIDTSTFPGYVDALQRALHAWTSDVAAQLPLCRKSDAAP